MNYPSHIEKPLSTHSKIYMTAAKSSFELHLEKLKGEYRAQLPSKMEVIESGWQSLLEQWQSETAVTFHRNVHSLIGTSGTFGFSDISNAARNLEMSFKPLLDKKESIDTVNDDLASTIHSAISTLRSLVTTKTQPR